MSQANSISFDDLMASPDDVSARGLAFARYWSSLPKRDFVPDRKDFDPSFSPESLPSFVILEVVDSENVRFRLVGTGEVERYGREVTGLNYLDFVPDWRRATASAAFHAVITHPCGMRATILSRSQAGQPFINETIGFPVRGRDEKVNLIYFQSGTRPVLAHHDSREDQLSEHTEIAGRTFINIGAGTPSDFYD